MGMLVLLLPLFGRKGNGIRFAARPRLLVNHVVFEVLLSAEKRRIVAAAAEAPGLLANPDFRERKGKAIAESAVGVYVARLCPREPARIAKAAKWLVAEGLE